MIVTSSENIAFKPPTKPKKLLDKFCNKVCPENPKASKAFVAVPNKKLANTRNGVSKKLAASIRSLNPLTAKSKTTSRKKLKAPTT